MNKYNNYTNELKRIGVPNYDGKQYEEYFKDIATSYVLCNLTGRQMAYVAVKMAAQKEFGFNECMKEFDIAYNKCMKEFDIA